MNMNKTMSRVKKVLDKKQYVCKATKQELAEIGNVQEKSGFSSAPVHRSKEIVCTTDKKIIIGLSNRALKAKNGYSVKLYRWLEITPK